MATIDNALTTVARYKSFAEITGNTKNTQIQMAIIGASAFVERYCNRKFKRQAFSNELYDGSGSEKMVLKNAPVISGQTFTLQRRSSDNFNQGDWETLDADAYIVKYEEGIIVLPNTFIKGVSNYRVSYTAGYYLPSNASYQDGTDDNLDLPFEIEVSVFMLVNYIMNRKKAQGIQSQRVRDVQITYMKAMEADPEIKQMLGLYKRFMYRWSLC